MNHAQPPRLIFLHVPKTAGTSTAALLKRSFHAEEVARLENGISPFDFICWLRALPLDRKRRLRLVLGHMGFGVHAFLPEESTYITVLRHPVDRIISLYYFIVRNTDHPWHEIIARMSFMEFALDPVSTIVDNFQVRMLAAEDGVILDGPLTDKHLERARHHLERHFALVGFQEHMAPFVERLQHLIQAAATPLPNVNVTPGRPRVAELSAFDQRKILDKNHLDARLNEFARQLPACALATDRVANKEVTLTGHRWSELVGTYARAVARAGGWFRGSVAKHD
ncbi:MAG: sulfotransferase family 2 domain-containing protein [Gemmataceae bacterium]